MVWRNKCNCGCKSETRMREQDLIWHPFTRYAPGQNVIPIRIDSAQGCYLYSGNRKILDAISSWWVNLHGHAHPAIVQAVHDQLQKLDHVLFAGFTHEPAQTLISLLYETLPQKFARFFFSDNGSTAVEVALKMVLQYAFNRGEKRKRIFALNNGYHGDTFGAMSVANRSIFNQAFADYLFEVEYIPAPEASNNEKIEEWLCKSLPADTLALIYEPLVQGAAGMKVQNAQLLEKILYKFKAQNAFLIADEVMTGFGRTGHLFASEACVTKPDIICLSKGLTGGFMPLGVTACTAEIFEAFESENHAFTFWHGHSYTAYPAACAAAVASLKILLGNETLIRRKKIAGMHEQYVKELAHSHTLQNARSCGTIFAAEIVSVEENSYTNSLRDRLYHEFMKRDVLIRPLGNTIYLMPPYCITDDELTRVYAVINEVCAIVAE